MAIPLPDYEMPPLNEVAIGAQFSPLADPRAVKDEAAWLAQWSERPNEILTFHFCTATMPYTKKAVQIASECFRESIKGRSMRVQQDPESNDEWLDIEIWVNLDKQAARNSYKEYLRRFVAEIPWPERDAIRLSYNLE